MNTTTMRKVQSVKSAPPQHWVGDGFPVRGILSYDRNAEENSPFLLFDYGGPADFQPAATPRGVDEHPHKGFETVTLVFEGEIAHRDSFGGSGKIGPGDVQWMTAGSGLVHEEKHSQAFTESGGRMEMAQLWVNLPAEHKGTPPKYQEILSAEIPVLQLPGGAGSVRVVAGEFADVKGPAQTFTPLSVLDVNLEAGKSSEFAVPEGWTALLFVRRGRVSVGEASAGVAELMRFDRDGGALNLHANEESQIILLLGEPIDEPIAAYGPFVMNTKDEIREAVEAFRAGKMGSL